MQSKREQAFVGFFVLIAVAVLFGTVFAMSGAYGRSTTKFHAYFAFAGGLEPGATVRYAGGPKVGRVDSIQLDPQNPARLDIVFTVQSDLPVKVDSSVKIMSMSPLGDNHLEIYPGTAQTPRAASGAALPSLKYVDFNARSAEPRKSCRNDRQCARNARRKPPSNQDHTSQRERRQRETATASRRFSKNFRASKSDVEPCRCHGGRESRGRSPGRCRASTHAYKHDRRHCAA